jgi:uncharacterized protein DUF3383
MGIQDIAAVSVALAGVVSPTRQGFGTPLLAAYFDPATHWQDTAQRIRFYPSGSALVQLVADGFETTDPIYRMFETALGQPSVPPQLGLGRRALPFTQILHVTLADAVAGGLYQISIRGSDGVLVAYSWPCTGVPATDAAVGAALFTQANIGTVTCVGAAVVFTQTAGKLTDLSAWTPTYLQIANLTVDPGIAADLTAINGANTIGWYGLSLDSNSLQEVEAAMAWVEATGQGGKWGFFDSADYANVIASADPVEDLNGQVEALSYMKSELQQSNQQVLSVSGFALASQILALSPGSYATSFKQLIGVVADTDQSMSETEQLTLNSCSTSTPGTGGKNGNWYKVVSGIAITFPGVTPGGRWTDIGIFNDWLQNNVQADLFAYFNSQPRIPLTDIGIQGALAVIKSRLKTGSQPPYGGIDASRPITVFGPTAASMSITDRNARNLSGLGGTFFYTGAIIMTTLNLVGSP